MSSFFLPTPKFSKMSSESCHRLLDSNEPSDNEVDYEDPPQQHIIPCEGVPMEVVNLFLNNFVTTQDLRNLSLRRLKMIEPNAELQTESSIELKKKKSKPAKLMAQTEEQSSVLRKLKQKLDNIRSFYPHIYFNRESVVDIWAQHNNLLNMNSDALEYDKESPSCIWI